MSHISNCLIYILHINVLQAPNTWTVSVIRILWHLSDIQFWLSEFSSFIYMRLLQHFGIRCNDGLKSPCLPKQNNLNIQHDRTPKAKVTQTFGIDTVFSVSTWHNANKLFFRPSKTSRICESATC